VNTFVLNAHKNDPHVGVPVDLGLSSLGDEIRDHLSDSVTIGLGVLDGGPFVMGLTKIIPVHLINANSKHPFIRFIDPFADKPFINKFIDKESSSVSVVENQWVSEGFGLGVI
jgi:hypothetical protein